MAGPDSIDSKYVAFQPQPYEVLAAFSLYSEKLPQNEPVLAQGLRATLENARCVGMDRFVDGETGQLTDLTRSSLVKLQEQQLLTLQDDSYVIPALDTPLRDKLQSLIRMFFKPAGAEVLQEAAKAATRVWFPPTNPA